MADGASVGVISLDLVIKNKVQEQLDKISASIQNGFSKPVEQAEKAVENAMDKTTKAIDEGFGSASEIAQQHEFEIISLGSNRRHMELPEYRAAIQEAEAVQEQTAAALQELADMQEKKTELKGEIKSLSGTVAALKAAERVRVDFDTIQPEKTLTGAVKGVTVDQIRQLKDVAMTGAAAKQTVVDLKKKNAVLEEEKAELKKKIPSVHEKMEAAAQRSRLESQNRQLWSENEELKEALEEERSFSDRLLEGIDRVLDMLERHLPKQLLHLVDKARDLLPEHQTYRQEKQHERGHSWGDMSL